MDINYKMIDTQRIMDYISSFPEAVSVESIILHSGADKLRVYPALFELEQNGWLAVVEREDLGAPTTVRKRES
ncbi:hypothetical protein [Bacteroides helcogenes]|uniref:Uncharacterized protein n=1 Tax=Bacteroides helcogenes (strain ATCC 35417 / DSM 20613 / JCM 6297 / CCUG 15421 / P 36-108) TaxID=693979 RepID=E6SPS7_BACT6|nr:hypothetical protein [Bacteroides helcogenes]ADV44906.1 hypothetical protein Bache_2972 [Bacteroides helcogenes P 36-108]MDY5239762.1 hypothetical protein [Bacteroides helcogenes]